MTELGVAVRDLVRFCFREGDIDHRFRPSPTAGEGIEGHQRSYRRRPASYQPEYPVSYRCQVAGLALHLRGRADGFDAQRALLEEIKTCRVAPASIPAALSRMHLAQARLYAALVAIERDLPELEVRLTWLELSEDREHPLSQHYTRDELENFLQQALARFAGWLQRLAALAAQREASLRELPFPHAAFRAGQRDLAERVYKCIDRGGQLLLEAPTGIGKTAAVLYPALKALGRGKHERLVFCTAKNSGRRAAEQAMAQLAAAGYRGSALTLSAKERVCLSPGRACHGDDCPYARGYYDRLPAAMAAALERPALGQEDLRALALEFSVCPYELTWDLLPWVDTVIADIHYLFSFGATLGAVALGMREAGVREEGARTTVLIDEAHNLPGRARRMYSGRLRKADLLAARRELPRGDLRRSLDRLNRELLALQKSPWQTDDWDARETLPEGLLQALQRVAAEFAGLQARQPLQLVRSPQGLDLYFDILQVLRCADHWGADYRLELQRGSGRQGLELHCNCLDASRLLAERQAACHSVVAFSATLSPWQWARDSLGLAVDTVYFRAASPFEPQQLQVSLATHIDTRYRQREASLPALAALVRDWLAQVPGNCLLFFPAYRYLEDCLAALGEVPGRRVYVQSPGAPEVERDRLLALLEQHRDVVGFCVLGGVFGEGIDLPGERLSSVVVVGVGLPQVNRDSEAQRALLQQRYGSGFAYAFQYPGMQKVSQALGRVIRDRGDRGRALLVDSRYREAQYRQLLPPWWQYRHYYQDAL
jgi:DNA excision repair protein ERCC-2